MVLYIVCTKNGRFMHHLHRTKSHSTNSELIAMVLDGSIDTKAPFCLSASMQTSGRGQHGRTFLSPKGGAYVSVYVPAKHASTQQIDGAQNSIHALNHMSGLLSLILAYALLYTPFMEHARKFYPSIGIKWPNDIGFYKNACFYKLCGILIEPIYQNKRWLGVVMGVGVNMQSAPNLQDAYTKSTSIADISHMDAQCFDDAFFKNCYGDIYQACLQATAMHNAMRHLAHSLSYDLAHNTALAQHATPNTSIITQFMQQFNAHHLLHHQHVLVLDNHTAKHSGIVQGVDDMGALILQNGAQTYTTMTGSIQKCTTAPFG